MGIVNFSIPKKLVLILTAKAKIDNFVETGTFRGATTFWAAENFKNVHTIEISEEISNQTQAVSQYDNINFIVGNSKDELPKLTKKLTDSSFFWLDGHWCMGAEGKENECPLMEELEAISHLKHPVIFIDDARCFLGPLPPPHDYSHWPMIDEIFEKLRSLFPTHFTTIIDDVIISVPADLRTTIYEYWMASFDDRFYPKPIPLPSYGARIKRKIISLLTIKK